MQAGSGRPFACPCTPLTLYRLGRDDVWPFEQSSGLEAFRFGPDARLDVCSKTRQSQRSPYQSHTQLHPSQMVIFGLSTFGVRVSKLTLNVNDLLGYGQQFCFWAQCVLQSSQNCTQGFPGMGNQGGLPDLDGDANVALSLASSPASRRAKDDCQQTDTILDNHPRQARPDCARWRRDCLSIVVCQ